MTALKQLGRKTQHEPPCACVCVYVELVRSAKRRRHERSQTRQGHVRRTRTNPSYNNSLNNIYTTTHTQLDGAKNVVKSSPFSSSWKVARLLSGWLARPFNHNPPHPPTAPIPSRSATFTCVCVCGTRCVLLQNPEPLHLPSCPFPATSDDTHLGPPQTNKPFAEIGFPSLMERFSNATS